MGYKIIKKIYRSWKQVKVKNIDKINIKVFPVSKSIADEKNAEEIQTKTGGRIVKNRPLGTSFFISRTFYINIKLIWRKMK